VSRWPPEQQAGGVDGPARFQRLFHDGGDHDGVALDTGGEFAALPTGIDDAEGDFQNGEHEEGEGQVAEEEPASHAGAGAAPSR
jgi:hypothetical protein